MKRFRWQHALIAVHLLMLALVVAPFVFYDQLFDTLASELVSGTRTLEVFVATSFLLAADVFIPVPSSAVSISAGMVLGVPLALCASLLGLTTGCFIGYGFGFYFRRVHFDRWYSDKEFRHLSSELSRYGYVVLLICRGVPILAEMSVIVAGFHRYPLGRFFLVTLAGNCILAGIYSYLGDSAINLTSAYMLLACFLLIPFLTFSARLWWLRQHLQGQ